MTGTERSPLTGAAMDAWAIDDAANAAVLAVAAGIDPRLLTDAPDQGFVVWSPPSSTPAAPDAALADCLGHHWDPDRPARLTVPARAPLRLVASGSILPLDVVPRLLGCPGVGSVIIPVIRPPGALRRRPWSWPLRIGVADDDLLAELAAGGANGIVPDGLVAVSDTRRTPGAVDVLVFRGGPAAAATWIAARRQVANAVVCIADSEGTWPTIDAEFALIRATSAAVFTALVPPLPSADIATRLLIALRYLSHAHPLDVALTAAFDRGILIAAEPEALVDVSLPHVLRLRAEQARRDSEVLRMTPPPAMVEPPPPPPPPPLPPPPLEPEPEPEPMPVAEAPPEPEPMPESAPETPPEMAGAEPPPFEPVGVSAIEAAADDLAELADGAFDNESDEASRALDAQERVDAALEHAAVPRLLQAYLGAHNVVRPGTNVVRVFVGPVEHAALQGLRVSNEQLGFEDPALTSARLTVVLAPLVPAGPAVRAELDVPRVGRSVDAPLEWAVPERGLVQARLLIIHRNRVLQTVRITGRVGQPVKVTERIVLWNQNERLDERQPFDRTFVLNHDVTGRSRVVSHADGATTIEAMDEIEASTDRIRQYLLAATQLTARSTDDARRRILVDVAVEGRDLYDFLADHLERFADAQRIQIVSARSGRFLPLEMIYDRPAPDDDAALCPNWIAGRACGDHCFTGDDDTTIVCPAVFWGMGRIIERQVARLGDADGDAFTVSATPVRGSGRLTAATPLLAASQKVKPADVKRTSASFTGARTVTTWADWITELGKTPTDLLVLMPHTDPKVVTLEISGATLRRGRIEAKHVTGGSERHPIVLLLGCDTAGSEEDPSGYANRFMDKGAAVVFSTLTMLLASHAATMSQRLARLLNEPGRTAQSLGEFVAEYRREAVREGLISALAVTAYGDADWSL